MSRGLLAGLVVGVVGDIAVFVARGLEDLFVGSVRRWYQQAPGAFRDPGSLGLTAWTATMGSAVLTLLMGVLFGMVFERMRPAIPTRGTAVVFGLLCWLGFLVPMQVIQLLWAKMPLGAAGTNLAGWLVMLAAGGAIAFRLTRE